jgi:S-adenosyl-L-methionine hydrolase (adenosine-forming)
MKPPIITLTTDFGLADPFVGIMKGVILNIAPTAQIVDITHEIEPQSILQAALALEASHPYFPKNTVHLVVVDPGVGSERRAIAVKNKSATFVGPDNGVLTPVIDSASRIYELCNKKYFLPDISFTFHGRDVFAPATAWIAKGTPLSKMGRKIDDLHLLKLPQSEVKKNALVGEIVAIDRFGNCISNISSELLNATFSFNAPTTLKIGATLIPDFSSHYSQRRKGDIGCLINSCGKVEIFCREGNAARKLKCRVGTALTIKRD